jgi:hypothetical protein
MRHIFRSSIPDAWTRLRADVPGLWSADSYIHTLFSCVRKEQGLPDGFLQVTVHSSHLSMTLGEGDFRLLNSRRNALCHAVMDKLSVTRASTLPNSRSVTNTEPTYVVCRALARKLVKSFNAPPYIICVNIIIEYLMLA